MAIARLSVKVGKAGKAAAHAAYIAREGPYASRLEKGEILEATEAGNMPAWAAANPAEFWRAADVHERANGTTYREFEVALPRELIAADRAALVRAFVAQELADKHAYQWAIHRPKAADGQDQPHAHIMFSERKRDGIERDPATYFKRWNAKAPEKGGARKRFGLDTTNRSQAERTAELAALRGRWESLTNAHLERAGVDARIDMRSYRARGIDREPERKQLPSAWRGEGRSNVIAFRAARIERDQAAADLRRLIPDPVAALADRHARRDRLDALQAERLAAFIAPKAEQEALPKMPPVLDQAPTPRARGGRFQDFGTIPVKETTQERRERIRAEREAERQVREEWLLNRILPEQAPEKRAELIGEYRARLNQRIERVTYRLDAARGLLKGREHQHAQVKPSKARMLTGSYGKAQAAYQAQGEALEQRRRDLDRRAGVVERYAEPYDVQQRAEAQVAKDFPQLALLAEREGSARQAKRLADLVAKQERERTLERGRKGRSR